MESQTTPEAAKPRYTLSILGAIVLVPSLWIFWLWIQAFTTNTSAPQEQKVQTFLSHFPAFLQTLGSVSAVSLLSSGGAVLLSALALRQPDTRLRIVSGSVIAIGGLIILDQLFALM